MPGLRDCYDKYKDSFEKDSDLKELMETIHDVLDLCDKVKDGYDNGQDLKGKIDHLKESIGSGAPPPQRVDAPSLGGDGPSADASPLGCFLLLFFLLYY